MTRLHIFSIMYNHLSDKYVTIFSVDGKLSKIDDKKALPVKPAFGGSSQAPSRKDSTGQKVESQSVSKSDEATKTAAAPPQVSQLQRTEKTPPFTGDKQQSRYVERHFLLNEFLVHLLTISFLRISSGGNQVVVGSKPDKTVIAKKDDSNYAHSTRGSTAPVNRGKPQVNAQTTSKPVSQPIPAKPVGGNTKPTSNPSQSQQPVSKQQRFFFK